MVASLGVIGALRFVRYTHANPPIARANALGKFLGGRMATYGLVAFATIPMAIDEASKEAPTWTW